jgi:hypothetical protein
MPGQFRRRNGLFVQQKDYDLKQPVYLHYITLIYYTFQEMAAQ